jgi:hypothetical protein
MRRGVQEERTDPIVLGPRRAGDDMHGLRVRFYHPAAGHSAFPRPSSESVRTLAPTTETVSEFSAAQKDEGRIVGVGGARRPEAIAASTYAAAVEDRAVLRRLEQQGGCEN